MGFYGLMVGVFMTVPIVLGFLLVLAAPLGLLAMGVGALVYQSAGLFNWLFGRPQGIPQWVVQSIAKTGKGSEVDEDDSKILIFTAQYRLTDLEDDIVEDSADEAQYPKKISKVL